MRPPVRVTGLDGFERRLSTLAGLHGVEPALREAAEEVRGEAARELATYPQSKDRIAVSRSLEIAPDGKGGFLVGTRLAAGHHLEFGMRARPASPFMSAALRSALPGLKRRLRTVLQAALTAGRR